MNKNKELSSLRENIIELDRALLELLRRRMELAARVGHIKAETGAPVVVAEVEDRVISRARQHAELCGVSPEVMEEIYQAIIRASVERQHRVGVEDRVQRGGIGLIIGGAGGMGGWFSKFLPLVGHRVDALDPAWAKLAKSPARYTDLDEVADLNVYDFIVVTVPLARTPAVLTQVVERRPAGLVVEIASIKDHLVPALEAAQKYGVHVSSLHPMFGPSKSPYEPLTFVLACHDAPDVERARLESLLCHPYTHLVAIPFAHHDRLMGWLLGLAHLTGMLFGAALSYSGLDPAELHACASTTFRRQAATALSVLSEDPALYLDIQKLNPHRQEVYHSTRTALEELVRHVNAGDLDAFQQTLTLARRAVTDEP